MKSYIQAEVAEGTSMFGQYDLQALRDNLNDLGLHEAHKYHEVYGSIHGDDDYGHYEVVIDTWASGPMLRMAKFKRGGEPEPPSADRKFTAAVHEAGFVPSGFIHDGADEVRWYLRPMEDVCGVEFEAEYAVLRDGGSFIQAEDGYPATMSERVGEQIAEEIGGETVKVVD